MLINSRLSQRFCSSALYAFLVLVLFRQEIVFGQQPENPCLSVLPELSGAALGSIEERKSKFEAIIAKCPGLAEARYNYGVMLLESAQPALAIIQFEEAVKLKSERAYRLGLASAQLAQGDLLTAKNSYQNILAEDAREVAALLGIATVMEKQGKAAESLEYLNNAYLVNPDDVFVNYNLGVIYDRLNQNDAAIVSFERVLKVNPRHAAAQFLLGLSLKKAGRAEESLQALKKASDLPDISSDGLRAYAFALEEAGSLDEAEIALRQALSSHAQDEKLKEQLVIVLLRKNQVSNAKPIIEQLLSKRPEEGRLLALFGWAQFSLGDLAGAESSLNQAVLKDPSGAFGFFALGELYRQTGRSELSRTNLETAYRLQPNLKERSAEWWNFW